MCLKQLSSQHAVLEHIKHIHVAKFSFQCHYCPQLFKTSNHRGVHVRRKHAVEDRVQKALMKTEPGQN